MFYCLSLGSGLAKPVKILSRLARAASNTDLKLCPGKCFQVLYVCTFGAMLDVAWLFAIFKIGGKEVQYVK